MINRGGALDARLSLAARRLRAAGVSDAPREARLLLRWALGVGPEALAARGDAPLDAAAAARFDAGLERRVAREPMSHITGRRAFFGREFQVTAAVLDPRPESETLVAAALAHLGPAAPARPQVLDLGVGSGCLLLSVLAERREAAGLGVDASPAALEIARANAAALGLEDRARFQEGDWAAGLATAFDLVLCNPPYIAEADLPELAPETRDYEPRLALTPGGDGLDAYRVVAPALPRLLAPGGAAFFEVGRGQAGAVSALFHQAEWAPTRIRDLDGVDRVVAVTKPAAAGR